MLTCCFLFRSSLSLGVLFGAPVSPVVCCYFARLSVLFPLFYIVSTLVRCCSSLTYLSSVMFPCSILFLFFSAVGVLGCLSCFPVPSCFSSFLLLVFSVACHVSLVPSCSSSCLLLFPPLCFPTVLSCLYSCLLLVL